MSGDAWIVAGTLLVMLAGLVSNRFPPAAVVLAATVTLLVVGIIDAGGAFSGFSNPAPITVAALYVLTRAAQKTALLTSITGRVLGQRHTRTSLARLSISAAVPSAFFNNTPLVAMLIPNVITWCRARGVSASRFLLPLSYAAILGGTVTVIGTSTNLVVSGLLADIDEPLSIFEMTPVSIVVAIVGLSVVVLIAPKLVPNRLSAPEQVEAESREFVVEMEVVPGGPLDGLTVAEAGLRDLRGVFLFSIARDGHLISPVAPDRRVDGGNVLTFVGRVDDIVDLQRMPGLRSAEQKHVIAIDSSSHDFYEAVVARASPLVGKTLREVEFRGTYQAAVIAIHRDGQRIDAKLGEVTLRYGDTLLLLAGTDFRSTWRDRGHFLLVAPMGEEVATASSKAPLVGLTTVAVVVLAALDILPILQGALLAAAAMVVLGVLTFEEAREAIDFDVILLIGAAFGLGEAMVVTGLAPEIADFLVGTFDPFGQVGVIFGILVATSLLTELVTNNAAVVVIFPIAMAAAPAGGVHPRDMAIAVAIAGSSSFLTPIGYQTNTMVYGPGGYRFTDYLRVGLPVNIVVLITLTAMTMAVS